MGPLDFFGGRRRSKVTVMTDSIWLNGSAKLNGIRFDVVNQQGSSLAGALLLAHFPDVLEQLSQIAAENANIPIKACLAKELSADVVDGWPLSDSAPLAIIVGERHPLPKHDDLVRQFAESLPVQVRLITHISFDDAFMKAFAGEWVEKLLQGLEMSEDECIVSEMVSERIKATQLQIEQKASGNSDADSSAEWLAANVAGMRGIRGEVRR